MANRTYLYAERPREDGTSTLIALGEYASDTPLAYRLLCSVNAQRVPSKLVDDAAVDEETGKPAGPTAIRASFPEGREALLRFMEQLAETNSKNLHLPEDTMAEEFASTRKELFDERFSGCTHFWMEPFEIFDLVAGGIEDYDGLAEELLGDVISAEANAQHKLEMWESGDFEPYRSAQDLFYSLGFGSWSSILYYDFSPANRDSE